MITRRGAIGAAVLILIGAANPVLAQSRKSTQVGRYDTDGDGTVDLAEAKKAAGDLFDKLDTDKDGTLSFKELHGRLSRKEFTAADTDTDQSLTREEYLAVVELRFKAADRDHDGTISSWEFQTSTGRNLARLLD